MLAYLPLASSDHEPDLVYWCTPAVEEVIMILNVSLPGFQSPSQRYTKVRLSRVNVFSRICVFTCVFLEFGFQQLLFKNDKEQKRFVKQSAE